MWGGRGLSFLRHTPSVCLNRCAFCGAGEEGGSDWVCCSGCDVWVHLKCDQRGGLRPFKEYKDGAAEYNCPRCAEDLAVEQEEGA